MLLISIIKVCFVCYTDGPLMMTTFWYYQPDDVEIRQAGIQCLEVSVIYYLWKIESADIIININKFEIEL